MRVAYWTMLPMRYLSERLACCGVGVGCGCAVVLLAPGLLAGTGWIVYEVVS